MAENVVKAALTFVNNPKSIFPVVKDGLMSLPNKVPLKSLVAGVLSFCSKNLIAKLKAARTSLNTAQAWIVIKTQFYPNTYLINHLEQIVIQLEAKIGNKTVIETVINKNDDLIVLTENGTKTNAVVVAVENNAGEVLVRRIGRAYKPDATSGIIAPASDFKMAVNYLNIEYVPLKLKGKIIEIEMTGYRGADKLAAIKIAKKKYIIFLIRNY